MRTVGRARRGWLIALVAAVVAAGGGALAWHSRYVGDPSPGALRDAVDRVAGRRCTGEIGVRPIDSIGGPGLPDGMTRAKEIVCDADVAAAKPEDEAGHPRLAIHYVFSSSDAAKAWLRANDYHLGDRQYGWWLHGRTLVGGVDLSPAEWRRVLASLK